MADNWHEWFNRELHKVLTEINAALDPDRPSRPGPTHEATKSDQEPHRYRFGKAPDASDQADDQLRPILDRMEGKLDAIHSHTGEIKGHTALLVERIPHDLRPMMAEIKELLLGRLRSTLESTKVDQVADQVTSRPEQDFHKALELLTPREKHLISKLVEHGFLTYRELAKEVSLSPTTVKNMINTMSKHPQKVSFIAKSRHPVHGTQVGISEELRDAILQGKQNPKKPR